LRAESKPAIAGLIHGAQQIVNIEAGVGVTGGSDRLNLQLMVSRDLNAKSK